MDVVERLIAEHRAASEAIDVLRKVHHMVETDGAMLEDIDRLRHFFRIELREHFQLEEKVFFPVVLRCFPAEKAKIVNEVQTEHPYILKALDYFEQAAKAYDEHITDQTRQNLRDVSRVLIETMIDHAQKEDRDLYAAVGTCFKDEDYRELERIYFDFMQKKS